MGIDSLGSLFLLEIKFERIEKRKNQGFLKLVSILSLFLTFIINTKPILEDGVFFCLIVLLMIEMQHILVLFCE
jgi:hypothetical protein